MSASYLPLKGKIAVVTGSAGRLGPCWAQALIDAGAFVVGIDLQKEARGIKNDRFVQKQGDVTSRAALEAIKDDTVAEYGTPEILINNAGIDQPPSSAASTYLIEDFPLKDFQQTLDINLSGTFNAIQVFGAGMANHGRGSIVNIGSLYATVAPEPKFYDHMEADPPFLKPAAYAASKAGVLQLTRYFARLWGSRGVRVNALSPGGVRDSQDSEFVRKYCDRVPLGRMATTDDLVGPLIFLTSDASAYFTGQNLLVDGGFTA